MTLRRFSTFATAGLAALVGCSDPAPLPVDGALTIAIQPSGACQVVAPLFNIPSTSDDPMNPPVVLIQRGEDGFRVTDGEKGASVSCKISGKDQFDLNASISQGSFSSFFVTGTVTSSSGTVEIREIHPDSVSLSSTECTLTPKFLSGEAIHADFNCPMFNGSMFTCSATGTFVFENCR
jgi:hypothetical protein